jgi:hypothetical protein
MQIFAFLVQDPERLNEMRLESWPWCAFCHWQTLKQKPPVIALGVFVSGFAFLRACSLLAYWMMATFWLRVSLLPPISISTFNK